MNILVKLAVSVLVLLLIVGVTINQWRKRKVKKWMTRLNLTQHGLVFKQLYHSVNGYALSKKARGKQDAIEYVYGEIEFLPFIALMSLTKPDPTTVFYDLGSGTGKAVLAMAMVFPVKKSVGIELFQPLHEQAMTQNDRLQKMSGYSDIAATIEFLQADLFSLTYDDATCIFINAAGFFGEQWEKIGKIMESSPRCKTIITTSKPLNSRLFHMICETQMQMSWGIVLAYIYERTTPPF